MALPRVDDRRTGKKRDNHQKNREDDKLSAEQDPTPNPALAQALLNKAAADLDDSRRGYLDTIRFN
jgi:hypothetical protein